MESISLKNKIEDIFYNEDVFTSFGIIIFVMVIFLILLFNPVTLVIAYFIVFKGKKKRLYLRRCPLFNLNFGVDGRKLPNDKDIDYFRDIPCNKNLYYAYWISYQYNLVSIDDLREGLIGAILLKWIKDGNISIIKTKRKFLSFKDNNYVIDLGEKVKFLNYIEYELYMMLRSSVNGKRYLKSNDFSKWCSNNYDVVERWFLNVIGYMNVELEKNGIIFNGVNNNVMYSYNNVVCKNVDISVKDEAIKLKGFKKFLLDFSLMPEKQYFDVHLWDEYLIFAMLLGIADRVEEQFSNLYPQFKQVSVFCNKIDFVKNISYTGYHNFTKSRDKNSFDDYSGTSRRSGGGGFSYSSGGSSARGSSGGGFR